MKPAKILKVVRQFRIESPRIANIVTQKYDKKSAIIKNKNGSSIVLAPNQLTKELKSFLEATGNKIDYRTVEARKGVRTVAGVKVKVLPIKFVNYSDGAFIQIPEDSEFSTVNANIVKEHLLNHGIDMVKECQLVDSHTQAGSCVSLFSKRRKSR